MRLELFIFAASLQSNAGLITYTNKRARDHPLSLCQSPQHSSQLHAHPLGPTNRSTAAMANEVCFFPLSAARHTSSPTESSRLHCYTAEQDADSFSSQRERYASMASLRTFASRFLTLPAARRSSHDCASRPSVTMVRHRIAECGDT